MLVNFTDLSSISLPFGLFYGHSGIFCGNFGIFSPFFGIMYQEKSGNPGPMSCHSCRRRDRRCRQGESSTTMEPPKRKNSALKKMPNAIQAKYVCTAGLPDGLFSNQKSQFG
jgi:hypothetical protein